MLYVKNLSFSYEKEKNKRTKNCSYELNNITFSLDQEKIYALIGSNGAGKTTLFKCILNMLTSYEGLIEVDGKDIKTLSARELAKFISYIPQQREIAFSYSVLDTILMGTTNSLKIYEKPKEKEIDKAKEALSLLGIEKLKYRSYNYLSGGEKQLVLIARAIAQNAKIILMDEPTSALDYYNQHLVMKVVRMLKEKGYGIIISCHNPQMVLNYSDELIAIKESKIVEKGLTKEIVSEKFIKKLYNMDVKIIKENEGYVILPI
ncbi:MAG: ABC transporter ATP-binding protein [Eubacteriales bacterium]|nr:ABC transporter ATP-binding protein [Eubacteriales bacterium]